MENAKTPKIKKKKLNPKQSRFCLLFATDPDCFGNGTATYLKVYSTKKKPITNPSARARAWALLTNINILTQINEYLEKYVMNDATVDRQLAFLIEQYADFGSKMGAIREYNKLKKRVSDKMFEAGDLPFIIKVEQSNVVTKNNQKGSEGKNGEDVPQAV